MQRGRGRHGGQQRPGPYDRVHEGRGRGGKGKGKGKDVPLQTLEIVNEPWRLIDAAAAEQTLDVCSRCLSGAAADTLQASINVTQRGIPEQDAMEWTRALGNLIFLICLVRDAANAVLERTDGD